MVSYDSDGSTYRMPVKLYKALKSTSSYPPDNSSGTDPDWEDLGAVNKHKMFDIFINTIALADGTESTDAGKIVMEIDAGKQDLIGLINLVGTKVTFELLDSADTVIDTIVYNLSTVVHDWEEYFYTDFEYGRDLIIPFTRLLVSNIKITIEHEITDQYPGLGYAKLGKRLFAGQVFGEPGSGLLDFSTVARSADGAIAFEEGDYAKTMSLDIRVANEDYDKVQKAVALIRGKPTIFEGLEDQDYEAFTVLGFVRNFDLILRGGRKSGCNLEIEGLI